MTEAETMITAVVLAVLFTLMVLAYYIGGVGILEKAGLRKAFRPECFRVLKIAGIIAFLTILTCLIAGVIKK